jgi:hypothetical protein
MAARILSMTAGWSTATEILFAWIGLDVVKLGQIQHYG